MKSHKLRDARFGRSLALIITTILFVTPLSAATPARMVVLGIDGMDPRVLQFYMDQGRAPNLKKLAASGGFLPLGTTVPPQSPVAWSTFTTGMNPGGHGLFDFLAIDKATLQPYMSSVRVVRKLDWGTIEIGDWQLPLVVEEPQLLRKGKTFWEILGEHGVSTRVFRVPANYPPTGAEGGRVISGMGTPDIRGSSGTFTYFTDDPRWKPGPVSGGDITRVQVRNGLVDTQLEGLANPFRAGSPATVVEMAIRVDKQGGTAEIDLGGQSIELQTGDWSDWLALELELIPSLAAVPGMVRFYLKETEPYLRLYASPINIDPRTPSQPIATPPDYAHELAEAAGPFYTQEMPEDTKALSAGVLKPTEFVSQSDLVLNERRALIQHELSQFSQQPGPALMFFYFSSLDLRNHMLARHQDPEHPNHDADTPETLQYAVRTIYDEMDAIVGLAMDALDENTSLVIMSDHGFSTFHTQVNLNTWLEQEGYLKLKDSSKRDDYEWFEGVDWKNTRAYAAGLNSLYINVAGREREGIVAPEEREALAQEIVAKLAKWRDEDDQLVITQPLTREDIYSGTELDSAPDVLVGYAPGYRASWATTSGKIPADLFEVNMDEWSGDHCIDSTAVPGVLLTNRPIQLRKPDLKDLTAAIIAYFGVDLPEQIEGKPAF